MQDSPIKELLRKGIQKSLEEQQVPLHLHLKVVEELAQAITRHKADINLHHVLMNRHALQLKEHDQMTAKEREAHQQQLARYDAEVNRLTSIDHLKGEPGERGYTPQKGIDYFDGETPSIDEIISRIIPILPEGKKGKDAQFDKDSFKKEMIEYIRKEKPLDISHIKGAQEFILQTGQKDIKIKFEEMLHGGGGSTGGGGFTVWTTTNTPDGNRTTFAVPSATAQPSFAVIDGVMKPPTSKAGTILWTWNAGVATVIVPPNDDIYFIK